MTPGGEHSTPEGEFTQDQESMYTFHGSVSLIPSECIDQEKKPEMQMLPAGQPSFCLFQMIFVLNGQLSFWKSGLNGSCSEIGSQQHNLCCIDPSCVWMTKSSPQDEIICISLDDGFLNRCLQDHVAWQEFRSISSLTTPVFLTSDHLHVTPEISSILHRLSQTSGNMVFDKLLLESRTMELLALQMSQFEQLQHTSGTLCLKREEMDKMVAARDLLINSAGKPLTLRELAHAVGTNEFNLKRNFKIAFGSTVYGYLNRHKMEEARLLLEEKDMTISEVASKMGYKYATHFSSAFKKHFGYLPSTLRSARLSFLLFGEEFSGIIDGLGLAVC